VTPLELAQTRRLAYGAWLAVCLIWGTTYLGIRISLESVPPFLMSGIRWTIAGALLALVLWMRGERLPVRADLPRLALLGFLFIGLGNGGVVWAEQWVPSGLTAVIVAMSPFWMVGVDRAFGGERLTARTFSGLALGFVGIVLLVWPELFADASRGFGPALIALQLAELGWALGSSYQRREKAETNVLATAAGQMLAGGLMMLAVGTAAGEWRSLHFTPRTAVALGYLTTIGSIGGFAAYTFALKHLPISFVSLYAYINPIIAVVLGMIVLGEPFNGRMIVAAGIVFAGVALVQTRRTRRGAGAPGPTEVQTVRPLMSRTRNSTMATTRRT
jgi:drug/metabolite transporter (DMT)-like permease